MYTNKTADLKAMERMNSHCSCVMLNTVMYLIGKFPITANVIHVTRDFWGLRVY